MNRYLFDYDLDVEELREAARRGRRLSGRPEPDQGEAEPVEYDGHRPTIYPRREPQVVVIRRPGYDA